MARFAEELESLASHTPDKRRESTPAEGRAAGVMPSAQRQAMSAGSVLRLQRSIGNASTAAYLQREETEGDSRRSPVHDVIGSGGSALDTPTRSMMEQHLGTDLSDVRLHVDRNSAESVSAAAYTVGNDVVLHPDHYSPGTPAAQRTLAHELTHVVQQRHGPVDGTPRDGGIRVSDPSDRFEQEAERSATDLMSQPVGPTTAGGGAGGSVQTLALQRKSEEEELPVQGIALQRKSEEEELPVQGIALQRESEQEEAEVQEIALQRESEQEEAEVQELPLQREAEGEESESSE